MFPLLNQKTTTYSDFKVNKNSLVVEVEAEENTQDQSSQEEKEEVEVEEAVEAEEIRKKVDRERAKEATIKSPKKSSPLYERG